MFEATVIEANAVEASDVAEFTVGQAIDFLNEYVFDAFLTEVQFADKGVARTKWVFV